jgi:hypothetical protein
MANAIYDKGRQAFANGGINLSSDTIKCALVGSGYTPSLTTHQFYSDLTPGTNVIGTPTAIGFGSDTAGVYKASGTTVFTSVASGSTVTYLAIYKDTGVAGTSPLIGLIDTATGLPVATNGNNITITWDATNGIFKL